MTRADFLSKFDAEGRFGDGDGLLEAVITTVASSRHPATFHFKSGLCVRIDMVGGGSWAYPGGSPLDGLRLLLYFEGENPYAVFIDDGRIVKHFEVEERPSKKEFLRNVRVARNLFAHPRVETDSGGDPGEIARRIARAALWLTPRSVAGFNADDFPELGLDRHRALQSAVNEFRTIARAVPSDEPASDKDYDNAKIAFHKIIDILAPYIPTLEEAAKVERAIDKIQPTALPPWVVNWDYELGSDEEGGAAVWLNLFVEEGAPSREFGRTASQLMPKLRQALSAEGVTRWPYVRIRTGAEHKAG